MENQNFLREDIPQEKNKYSADFVSKVKTEFPNWTLIKKALDSNSEIVGRYLDDSRSFSMKPEDIIEAFENGRTGEVLEAAKRAERIDRLYIEWNSNQK